MQLRAVLLSVLVASVYAVSIQAEVKAKLWLSEHAGNPDELAELKTENPDAYALVKALLTKRSLGLLDPKHPTASFASPPKEDVEKPVGAALYAKFATTAKDQAALRGGQATDVPYPDAPEVQATIPYPDATRSSHDWINWKPHDSGADDDAMVKNVLGAVADLTKGKSLRSSQDAVQDDSSSSLAAETVAVSQTPMVLTNPPAISTTASQVATQENSYLKVLDVAPTSEPASASSGNSLTSFTFDDDASGASVSTTTTTVNQASQKRGSNPLASWLGMTKPHVQTAASSAPVQVKPSNPYLMDLQ